MILPDIGALRDALTPGTRLLGLDLGDRTIGLAASDAGLRVASGLETVRRNGLQADSAELAKRIDSHGIGGLVLGLPINMDGSEGPRAQATRQFADNLQRRIDLPLAFWDERLSTAAVERVMIDEADLSRRKRRRKVDQAAATWILQGALDFLTRDRQTQT